MQKFNINSGSKSYVLMANEFIGTNTLKHLISSELRGDTGSTYFLLGIPNPVVLYSCISDVSPDGVRDFLFKAATDSVADFLGEDEWEEGKTYYGEFMEDRKFHISSEKPSWEDGNWGQLMK